MKNKSRDRIDATGHLSNILYTAKRSTIADLDMKRKPRRRKSRALSTLSDWLGELLFSRKKQYRPSARRRNAKAREDNRAYYMKIGAICCAVLFVSSMATVVVSAKGGKSVIVNDAGRILSASTDEATVGAFLNRNGIAIGQGDVVSPNQDTSISENMEIVIHRAMSVKINVDGQERQSMMLGGTVEQALENANIIVGEDDEVYPSKDTYIKQGMSIGVVRVKVVYETEKETLYYKETEKSDKSVSSGKRILKTKGENGLQENTVKVLYKNGVEVSREITETKVLKEPVDEVVLVGTYVEPTPAPTPKATAKPAETGKPTAKPGKATPKPSKATAKPKPTATKKKDTGANNPKDDAGKLTKIPSVSQIHSGTLKEHKAVPGPASSIIKKTVVTTSVTAYAPTGRKTATGTWPKIGTIAANPKIFPYGTKLYIPGYGYGRVEDTGSGSGGDSVIALDLLMESEAECRQWGRKRGLKVYVLG